MFVNKLLFYYKIMVQSWLSMKRLSDSPCTCGCFKLGKYMATQRLKARLSSKCKLIHFEDHISCMLHEVAVNRFFEPSCGLEKRLSQRNLAF